MGQGRRRAGWVLAGAGIVVGCSRPAPTQSAAPAVMVPAVAEAGAAGPVAAAGAATGIVEAGAAPVQVARGYPVGDACSADGGLAEEHRSLPAREKWVALSSRAQRLRLRVPPGVFTVTDGREGLRLVSALKARELGPDGKDRHFAIRFLRVGRSVDALLADTSRASPLAGIYLDGPFPDHTAKSFVGETTEPVGSGASARTTLAAGRPAYVWITGVEGYDSDNVLVNLGVDDTLVAVADWNSAIMSGQPECYQRVLIGGVMESLELASP